MNAVQGCPKCGTVLSSHAFEGLCPACVVQVMRGVPAIVPVTVLPGDNVGRYKLIEKIGEGGCGIVYLAEQEEPVRRRVALKVIKLGMDTAQVIARFKAERQTLALMDHPNIAKVLDAGATDTGRPFFVMELVRGVRITDCCTQRQLSTVERLDLFIQVCQAIQHAHQKGIIHRDLKPSNVLVTQHDGVPLPKVIDFGIAKATSDQRLTDKTLFTAFEQFIGTPAYMSPEQAEMSAVDIDTRSDIYSLGVLLYELLTGSTPFDTRKLLSSGIDAMRRTIREEEPPRPSTRHTQLQGDRRSKIEDRKSRIENDLDWIVMKCLEKDRARRYETASGLAADLKRFLASEPVTARPPSATYRFGKLVRRNKLAFAAGMAVVLALLFGVLASTWQAARAMRAEREATQERNKTGDALKAQTRAKVELEQTLEQQRIEAYFHRITLAHRELSADNLGRGLDLLRECPEDLREWEWHYLMRLCRIEPLILPATTEIYSVAYHPNGGQIAAACDDGTVKIADATNGAEVETFRGHNANVFGVAFSRDGRRIASASADRTIRLWDLASGREVFRRPGHVGDYTGMAYGLAFSPDGQLLVAGGEEGIAMAWNTADGSEAFRLSEKHENTAVSATFSRDGRFLATGSWAGLVRIWDGRTGELVRRWNAHTYRISAIVFDPKDRWLATASFDRTIKIWNPATGELLETLRGHTGVISCLACSHDGRRLFSGGSEDRTVRVWDPLSGREVLNLRGHTGACQSLAFDPAGDRLASAGGDACIRIWDATRLEGNEGMESLSLEHEDEVWSVGYSPDRLQMASGTWGGTLRLWSARTGAHLRTLTSGDIRNIFQVAVSPDGSRIAASTIDRDRFATVRVWETATGKDVFSFREKGLLLCVTYDPTGRYLLHEGPEHTVQVRDADTGKVVGLVGRHDRQIWCMAFSHDSRVLATASSDDTVRGWTWDPTQLGAEQQPRFKLPVHTGGYGNRVAFSSDGQHLATGGEGPSVNIWNASTGAEEHTLAGHTGNVFALAFSPGGRWLASAGEDTTIRIWDARSWKLLRTLRGHTGWINSLAFSLDGARLASGSRDGTIKIWDETGWDDASVR